MAINFQFFGNAAGKCARVWVEATCMVTSIVLIGIILLKVRGDAEEMRDQSAMNYRLIEENRVVLDAIARKNGIDPEALRASQPAARMRDILRSTGPR